MRLIDTKTHLLLEPWKAAGKEYAILSHTWGDQEVIFQEWEQLYPSGAIKGQCPHVHHQGIDKKAGYFKVMQACEQAQRDGFRYLWCDTTCINKESSAELSEAINSMFKWYRDAKVCYVYLTDVTFPCKKTRSGTGHSRSNDPGWFSYAMEHKQDDEIREMRSRFMASRWWTRGWTLQELLAPTNVVFFTKDWTLLGHKSSIAHWISASTHIHREALEDQSTISSFSVAQRMSWAAGRQTTVVEDMAYCLLGIFEINMPMLYGQGPSAFQKLQHEIIKVSNDQSIFAWTTEHDGSPLSAGPLAESPHSFRWCGSITFDSRSIQEPYSLTNVGFKMRVSMIRNDFKSQFFIGLNCSLQLYEKSLRRRPGAESRRRVQIWIPVQVQGIGSSYERIHTPTSHVYFQKSYPSIKIAESLEIYLCESPLHTTPDQTMRLAGANGSHRTGIVVAVGFGHMSMVSKAYQYSWYPERFQTISLGSRQPTCTSHEIVASGNYIIIFSVAWNERSMPRVHMHTTVDDYGAQKLGILLDRLGRYTEQVDGYVNDIHEIHKMLRSMATATEESSNAPMIAVEEESLYDTHDMAYVMADVIFKEKPRSTDNRT